MDGRAPDPLRQHILEAVDCLRLRKCRPDRESIAHYVLRKFGSSMNEIFAELENIVDEEGLIKVEYKGTISYRSPSSFDTKNSPLLTKHSKILNSSKTTRLITTGINELLVKDPNYTKEGVPLNELKASLVGFDSVRFGEEKIELILERENICGSIFLAKSEVLDNSLRVFPKDIPIPSDMKVVTLNSETSSSSICEKEEKKPKKPRKGNGPPTPGTSGTKKVAKTKVKQEHVDVEEEVEDEKSELTQVVFAVKSEPQEIVQTGSNSVSNVPPKKNSRLIPSKRLVPEQIAVAVRKTYEQRIQYETASARMMKLAECVVKTEKTSDSEEHSKSRVPTLVLAETENSKGNTTDETNNEEKMDVSSAETSTVKTLSHGAAKRKGRVSMKKEKTTLESEDDSSKIGTTSPQSSPNNDHGLTSTRSKRDKRKKKVFDPSDLPNTYSSFAAAAKTVTRRSRSTTSPSPEEPPQKKIASVVSTRQTRVSPRKSLPILPDDNKKTDSNMLEETQRIDDEGEISDSSSKNGTIDPNQQNKLSPASDTTDKIGPKPCDYCSESKKKETGEDEEYLTCATCHSNIHPSCMEYSTELAKRILSYENGSSGRKFQWNCLDCKKCAVCKLQMLRGSKSPPPNPLDTKNMGLTEKVDGQNNLQFILCENCDVGYHAKCVDDFPKDSLTMGWVCRECKPLKIEQQLDVKDKKKPKKKRSTRPKSELVGLSKIKKESESVNSNRMELDSTPKDEGVGSDEEKTHNYSTDTSSGVCDDEDESQQDITTWSLTDVENYFVEKGLKEEAAILKGHEVDGYSLMLLKREDIIHGMGFRLGPALKLNRLVYELQAKAPVKPKWPNDQTVSTSLSENDNPPFTSK